MNYIDLFAGCGGLSLGLSQAGLQPVFAIESNADAFATYKHNLIDGTHRSASHLWPEGWLPIVPHNIRSIRRNKAKYEKPLLSLQGEIDIVAGGPPCQGFSTLGRRNSRDPRNQLVHDYLWFVQQVRPKFILLENVSGMAANFYPRRAPKVSKRSGKSGASKLMDGLESHYSIVTARVFRASDFGVPQVRPRFIAIAVRRDAVTKQLSEDEIRHKGNGLLHECRVDFLQSKGLAKNSRVSSAQAISDLETRRNRLVNYDRKGSFQRISYSGPRTKYQKDMHGDLNGAAPNSLRIPNHRTETLARFEYLHELVKKGGIVAGKCIDRDVLIDAGVTKHLLAVLNRNMPSRTISTLPDDLLHYSEPRILTVRENARLQSFPDWFEFTGKYTTGGHHRKKECPRYTQVGNAVAPRFAEFLGYYLASLDQEISK